MITLTPRTSATRSIPQKTKPPTRKVTIPAAPVVKPGSVPVRFRLCRNKVSQRAIAPKPATKKNGWTASENQAQRTPKSAQSEKVLSPASTLVR